MASNGQGKVAAAYHESVRRFPRGGARFVVFSVLFLAITLAVFVISVLVIVGSWDLEGANDRTAGLTFLGIAIGALGLYWWMVGHLTRSKGSE